MVFPIVQSYKFKSKSQLYKERESPCIWCFRQFKVTNSKANHNGPKEAAEIAQGVSDSSKLQIQKQITTARSSNRGSTWVFPIVQSYKFKSKSQQRKNDPAQEKWCFRQFKVTNSKANHNLQLAANLSTAGVSDSSKLQIQKQITTFQSDFDVSFAVFPIVQSYKFKSKSQPRKL